MILFFTKLTAALIIMLSIGLAAATALRIIPPMLVVAGMTMLFRLLSLTLVF